MVNKGQSPTPSLHPGSRLQEEAGGDGAWAVPRGGGLGARPVLPLCVPACSGASCSWVTPHFGFCVNRAWTLPSLLRLVP